MRTFCILIIFLNIHQIVNGKITVKKLTDPLNKNNIQCEQQAYPPPEKDRLPSYTINLDDPPRIRWKKLIEEKKEPLKRLVNYVQEFSIDLFGEKIFRLINNSLPEVTKSLPAPYEEEIYGIAQAGGLTVTQVTLYNIFYEVFSFCTSIVAQDHNGKLYHARNLDFGLFMGWDKNNHTWIVAELLRPLVIQLQWTRKGKIVFESSSYTGFIGVLTAVKKDHFTFSLDERFTLNGGYVGLLEWILFKDYDQHWVSFLARNVMEQCDSYDQAVDKLTKSRLLAPVYFIVGGNKPNQATLITRYRDDADLLHLNSSTSGQASWFLVETNYDHWKNPPFYDNRRGPAIQCLETAGQSSLGFPLLYNVLSTKPVLNKLTTFTSLMDVQKGFIGTWLRTCEDPCWPW